jgi:hypothetical protein
MKKRRLIKIRNFQINFSNKIFYTILLISTVILLGVGVYAVAPNPGHTASEIDFSGGFNVPSGNVGIGTTDPSQKLHVAGSTRINNYLGVGVDPSSTHRIYASGVEYGIRAHGSTMGGRFQDSDGTSTTYVAYGGYGVYTGQKISAGGYYYTSDERLKENIVKIGNAVDTVESLEGVSFNWKENGEKDIGLVAQDVEKVLPEVVLTDEETGMKSISYGNIVAVLIEAIKEQQEEIDELKEQIKDVNQ